MMILCLQLGSAVKHSLSRWHSDVSLFPVRSYMPWSSHLSVSHALSSRTDRMWVAHA